MITKMKSKILTLSIASVFLAVLILNFTSAILIISNVPTLSQTGNSFTITVQSDQTETANLDVAPVGDGKGNTITFTPLNSVALTANTSKLVTINYAVPSSFDFSFEKDYSTALTAQGSLSSEVTQMLNFEKDICEGVGDHGGDLRVSIDDVTVTKGFGDGTDWFPLDEIEVKVDVENNNNDYDIQDIKPQMGLFNLDDKRFLLKDSASKFKLNDGDDKSITFTFTLDKSMSKLDTANLVLYVWANGKLSDSDKTSVCAGDSQDINLIIESDFVILDNLQMEQTASCGDEIHVTSDVWNIGDSDQDDVLVKISNSELGINEVTTFSRINALDNEKLDTMFKIPSDAQEKTYPIAFEVYDENGDLFVDNYNDDQSRIISGLTLSNCANTNQPISNLNIAANLLSGGNAGEALAVEATITNTGNSTATYNVNVAGYSPWASSASLDKNVLTLNKGESEKVLITLNVNSNSEGANTFNIEVLSGNQLVAQQPVSVNITAKKGFLSSITGGAIASNPLVWGIGIINLVLVILIIIVAVRILRK
jgi:uncharacterized membrane protein